MDDEWKLFYNGVAMRDSSLSNRLDEVQVALSLVKSERYFEILPLR